MSRQPVLSRCCEAPIKVDYPNDPAYGPVIQDLLKKGFKLIRCSKCGSNKDVLTAADILRLERDKP